MLVGQDCRLQVPGCDAVEGAQHDVQVGYRIPELLDSEFQIGIRNLADRQPPLIYSGFNASTDLRTYDGVGRFYWMRWTARF